MRIEAPDSSVAEEDENCEEKGWCLRSKRKYNNITDETELSTSPKPKHYQRSTPEYSPPAQSGPVLEDQPGAAGSKPPQVSRSGIHLHGVESRSESSNYPCQLDRLERFSQHMQMLREQARTKVETMERQGTKVEAEKMHQEELLKDVLQEQRSNMIEEMALSRQGFEQVLLAKDKELQTTRERAQAQKEEVVTQVTEVLRNELQCVICTELFIEAVILSCAHSFCMHCIGEWLTRSDDCPICRQRVLSQTRCLALDNFIERMVENLSLDMKVRRQALVSERKVNKPEEVSEVFPDEDQVFVESSRSPSGSDHNDDDDDDDDVIYRNMTSVLSVDSRNSVYLSYSPSCSDIDEDYYDFIESDYYGDEEDNESWMLTQSFMYISDTEDEDYEVE